jgi:hypothetical protein
MNDQPQSEFEHAVQQHRDRGLVSECWAFLRHNKKWWLLPFLAVVLLFGVLVWLSGTGAGPFLYTLF